MEVRELLSKPLSIVSGASDLHHQQRDRLTLNPQVDYPQDEATKVVRHPVSASNIRRFSNMPEAFATSMRSRGHLETPGHCYQPKRIEDVSTDHLKGSKNQCRSHQGLEFF